MADSLRLLIVQQRSAPHPEVETLAAELGRMSGLDPYTVRMRLLGPGLAQLAKGGEAELAAMGAVLARNGYASWVLLPPHSRFAPPRLRSLTVSAERLEFFCEGDQLVPLERGVAVVGVLADLSGELAGKQAQRLLARNAYLGREQARLVAPEELRQAILKGQPVFDCYLLDAAGSVTAAFRALPGRFNPEGLGGRASLGAARNLEAVVELVGEYAGTFRLYTDFGLSQLPGCTPQSSRENPEALQGNLEALTRYGWLVAALTPQSASPAGRENSVGEGLAAGVVGLAVATGLVPTSEELATLAGSVDEAVADQSRTERTPPPTPLPSPPDRPEQKASLRRALPFIIATGGGVLFAVAQQSELLGPFFEPLIRSGALSGAAALALAWWGFVCLRLKRHIEDTPTSRIRSLAMGLVEVQGRALRRYALVAPMSQGACVWYRLRKYRRDNRNNWQLTSQSDSSHVPFVLADGSGQVLVDPAGATVKAKTEQVGYPGASALIGAAFDGDPDEKWVEELIYEGTTLYVLGYARPICRGSQGLRERTLEKLRQLKLDPQARRRYDANGDGRLDTAEWQAAREDAERLAAAEQLGSRQVRADSPVVIGRPPAGLPFLLAEGESGAGLAVKYGRIGAVLLVLATAAFALSLKLFLGFLRLI